MRYIKTRKFELMLSLIIVVVTWLPYWAGYSAQNENWKFTGFVVGVEDGNSYLAKMRRGAEGDWWFDSSYSTSPQKGAAIYMPYTILGKLSLGAKSHLQFVILYHLFRTLGVFVFIFATSDFISVFITENGIRKWALILISLGGGLGWALVVLQQKHIWGSIPLEFLSPESFGFLALLGFPHLLFSRALMLWGLSSYLNKKNGYTAGLIWLVMGFFQPLVVLVCWIIIGMHGLVLYLDGFFATTTQITDGRIPITKYYVKILQACLISAPVLFYTTWAYFTDPYLIGWLRQNNLPSPHIIHYLIAYGLMLPFIYSGLKNLLVLDRVKALLLLGWMISLPVLIYIPINSQRRMAEGIWSGLVVLALAHFDTSGFIPYKWKSYFFLAFPSTLILIIGSIQTGLEPAEPAFRPRQEIAVYEYLAARVEKDQVTLSSYEISNNIPAWIPVKVVYGHGVESIDKANLEADINEMMSGTDSLQRRKSLLHRYNVDYIIWGPIEESKWAWSPDTETILELMYNNNGYRIYRTGNN